MCDSPPLLPTLSMTLMKERARMRLKLFTQAMTSLAGYEGYKICYSLRPLSSKHHTHSNLLHNKLLLNTVEKTIHLPALTTYHRRFVFYRHSVQSITHFFYFFVLPSIPSKWLGSMDSETPSGALARHQHRGAKRAPQGRVRGI